MLRVFRTLLATFAVAAVGGLVAPVARAATITVDTTTDPQFNDGSCSLRNAVVSANTDTAVNGCAAGAGADTIILGMGVYRLAIGPAQGDTTGQNGDLDLLHTTTIIGAGSSFTIIDANDIDRVFDVQPNVTATISGVALEHGNTSGTKDSTVSGGDILVDANARLTISASAINLGGASGRGGGIYSIGTLTITNSQLRGNAANAGGAIASEGSSTLTIRGSLISGNQADSLLPGDALGGAVYISGNQRLNASGSSFQDNTAQNDGGAIYTAGPLSLGNDSFIQNSALGNGAGIQVAAGATGTSTITGSSLLRNTTSSGHGGGIDLMGPVTIATSTLSANSSAAGGGVYVESTGNLTVNRSTISNNDGASNSAGNGDGIYNAGTATLTNTTVSGNGQVSTHGQGGGIYNSGSLTLLNDTIAMNEASFASGDGGNIYNTGSASAMDTIIAVALTSGDCGGTAFTSAGNNLKDGDTSTCFVTPQPSDVFADPLLGPLQNNGGPTKTHAIPAASPAKDAGATCSTIDQRGVTRPQGAGCEIGAYEFALCGTQIVNIVGTSGNDTLNGTGGNDGILGLSGNDVINGNAGNDSICPAGGNDTANGGTGNDTFFLKDSLADTADGGAGTDTATIDSGLDTTTTIEVIH